MVQAQVMLGAENWCSRASSWRTPRRCVAVLTTLTSLHHQKVERKAPYNLDDSLLTEITSEDIVEHR